MRSFRFLLTLVPALCSATTNAQAPAYAWAKFAGNAGGQQASGRAIAVDRNGNVIVAGVGAPSITWGSITLVNSQQYIVKMNHAGTVLWAKAIPMRPDHLATDGEGNIYLSSAVQGPITLDGTPIPGDFSVPSVLLVKYDPMGNVIWFKNHTPGSGQASPGRVMTDASDNVYLCGAFNTNITIEGITYPGDPANGSTVFAVSYTPDGTYRRSNATTSLPPTSSLNAAPAAACDTTLAIVRGGVFGGVAQFQVGGHTLTVTSQQSPAFNAYLIKWDPDGEVAWARASGGIGTENISDVLFDGHGRVVASGGFTGHFFDPDSATVFGHRLFLQSQSYNLMDMFVGVFSADGEGLWMERAGGNHVDGGARLVVDPMDNVYAFGSGQSGLMSFGHLTIYPYSGSYLAKYSRSGTVQWVKLMAAGQGDGNSCHGVAIDVRGNAHVTGMQSDTIRLDGFENITSAQNDFDVFVAKLNNCTDASFDLSADGPTSFCPGDSVTLQGPAAVQYQWNTGAHTGSITTAEGATYHLITANEAGCLAYSDTLITTIVQPIIPHISLDEGVFTSTMADAYQWNFQGDPIPGATNSYHDPDQEGDYSVTTVDANGCVSTSNAVFLSTVGVEERMIPHVRIIPMGDGWIGITLHTDADALSIVNSVGMEVWHIARPGGRSHTVQLPASGIYFLRSTHGDTTEVTRFVAIR